MRWAELLLFAAPFLVFLVWRRFSAGRGPSTVLLGATLLGLALFGGVLAWLGVHQRLDPNAPYVPAMLQDGRIIPGHSARP